MNPLDSLPSWRRFVREHPLGVVATVGADGDPGAALVGLATAADGTLLFNSRVSARKVTNLGAHSRVAVVVGCVGVETVQVEGDAAVLRGPSRTAAAETYCAAFPGSRNDADIAFVAVLPAWLRYYVTAPDTSVVEGRPVWAP